jgi:hypothetical protein
MDCQLTEIDRNYRFRLFSVTEINRSPYRGARFSVIYFGEKYSIPKRSTRPRIFRLHARG